MEIWIIGGIIVALMIYASTKIKRAAANAYEREEIAADGFALIKPEGFISLINSAHAFEAQSKEFGESEKSEELYRARATVTMTDGSEPASESRSERDVEGVTIKELRKTINADGRGFELAISVLADHYDEFEPRIREMAESFEPR